MRITLEKEEIRIWQLFDIFEYFWPKNWLRHLKTKIKTNIYGLSLYSNIYFWIRISVV